MRQIPGRTIEGASLRRPVVLLHGFASSPRVMRPLAHFLQRRRGDRVAALPVDPGGADLRDCARELRGAVTATADAWRCDRVDLVAHSMGGLIGAYLLKAVDRGRRIRSVITLGTPHQGTPWARLGVALLGFVRPAVYQMLPGSDLVAELNERTVPDGCGIVSVGAGRDTLVPLASTRLAPARGHRQLQAPEATHTSLLCTRSVFRLVEELLGWEWSAKPAEERLREPFPAPSSNSPAVAA